MTDDAMPLTGALSPPLANGEVVFEAPWQGRIFAMCRQLCESGCYDWDEFRQYLIEQIGEYDASPQGESYAYFDHFMAAFERLLIDKGLCEAGELQQRFEEYTARPHGHDH